MSRGFRIFAGFFIYSLSQGAILGALNLSDNCFAQEPQPNQSRENPVKVIAEVNGRKIFQKELKRALQQQLYFQQQYFEGDNTRLLGHQLLERLIDRALLVEEANRAKLAPNEEQFAEVYRTVKEQAGSAEHFAAMLKESELSEEELQKGLREDIAVQEFLNRIRSEEIEVTPKEVEEEYNAHKAQYAPEQEVHARQIFFSIASATTEAEKETIRHRAEEVLAELQKNPKNFSSFARKYSDGPSRGKGGDLGFFTRNQMPKEFTEAVFALHPGELSGIIESESGYHIVFLEAQRGGAPAPLTEIAPKIKQKISNLRTERKITELLEGLRKSAKIVRFVE